MGNHFYYRVNCFSRTNFEFRAWHSKLNTDLSISHEATYYNYHKHKVSLTVLAKVLKKPKPALPTKQQTRVSWCGVVSNYELSLWKNIILLQNLYMTRIPETIILEADVFITFIRVGDNQSISAGHQNWPWQNRKKTLKYPWNFRLQNLK